MECMTHTHTSIHSFIAGLFDSAKLYFHITEEVHYSRQPQRCYIKTGGGGDPQKATLVSFYLDASTSNAGFDKVTASKSSEALCVIHLTIQPGRSTRCNKGGEQQSWRETENERGE